MDDLRSGPRTRSSSSGTINSETQPKILKRPANSKDKSTTKAQGSSSDTENHKASGSPGSMCGGSCESRLSGGNDSIECERC